MLTDEEQVAFRKSIDGVRSLAARNLCSIDNVGRAIGFIAILHRGIDTVALRASELGPVPECRIGCSYCCHVRVEVTDPEVFRIVRRIRQLPVSEVADRKSVV